MRLVKKSMFVYSAKKKSDLMLIALTHTKENGFCLLQIFKNITLFYSREN